MKHYIEIQRVRETDVIVDDTLTLSKNTDAFCIGDIISITEKIDGANSSIYYDSELDGLRCFSSRNELDFNNQLRGFLPFVHAMNKEPFKKYPNYIFFGEWLVKHSVIYNKDNYNRWYLFSVYDRQSAKWLPQSFVKQFAEEFGFEYVHELYYGEFISWEHCISFANNPAYGEQQEGIVIKNQTALKEERGPHILKYVNPSFKETQKRNHRHKLEDPNKLKEKSHRHGEWIKTKRMKTTFYDKDGEAIDYVSVVFGKKEYEREENGEVEVYEGDTNDYWLDTAANAVRPLYQLIALAKMRPDCIWDGD